MKEMNGYGHAKLGSEEDVDAHSILSDDSQIEYEMRKETIYMSNEDFPQNLSATTRTTRSDLFFSTIVTIICLIDFGTDIALVWLHYSMDMKWGAGITFMFMVFGAGGILSHFTSVEIMTLARLFLHSKRIKLLVSCFPFLGSFISSYHCTLTAWRSWREPILSQQFFALEDFSLNLLRIQSFFQSAPQAAFQLILLMESLETIGTGKATVTILGIVSSLAVMTVSNVPYRNEKSPPPPYGMRQRLFIGSRMFCSFGSRAMSVAYLFMAWDFLVRPSRSAYIALIILIVPRLLITVIDYARRVKLRRKSVKFSSILIGYFATILIPMSEPVWVFYYIWIETSLFITFGVIVGFWTGHLSPLVNGVYVVGFLVSFILVPVIIPLAKKSLKKSGQTMPY
jgi:hypothetical protein